MPQTLPPPCVRMCPFLTNPPPLLCADVLYGCPLILLGSRLYVVGLQPTVIASRAPYLLLEQSVMTIERIVDVRRPSRFKVNGSPARSHVTLLFCPSLQNHNTAGLHFYPTSCGVIRNQRRKIRRIPSSKYEKNDF